MLVSGGVFLVCACRLSGLSCEVSIFYAYCTVCKHNWCTWNTVTKNNILHIGDDYICIKKEGLKIKGGCKMSIRLFIRWLNVVGLLPHLKCNFKCLFLWLLRPLFSHVLDVLLLCFFCYSLQFFHKLKEMHLKLHFDRKVNLLLIVHMSHLFMNIADTRGAFIQPALYKENGQRMKGVWQ